MNARVRLSLGLAALAALVAGVVLSSAARGESPQVDYAPVVAKLEQLVEGELARGVLTGVSVALVDDQQTVFAQGFGWADQAERRPATRGTVYRAGSISKLFTALAAMQLVEQGKLALDASVPSEALSCIVPFDDAGPITLRQLMCHRSGLVRESPVGGYFDPSEPSIADAVASLADCVLVHRPNTVTKYSNIGVTVVGHAVEEASGEAFAEYQQEHLLEPIGMTRSSFLADQRVRPHLANSYMQVADGQGGFRRIESPRFELGTLPAGNLYTSAEDLARFLAFLFARGSVEGKPLVRPETLDLMLTPQLVEGDSGYGLGFYVDRFRGRKRVSHMGAVYGFTSSVAGIPELKVGAVVLANEDVATGPVCKLADAALRWMVDAKAGSQPPPEEKPKAEPAGEPEAKPHQTPADPAPLDPVAFVGDYESSSYWARIDRADGGLAANVSGQRLTLSFAGPDKFTADGRWTTDAAVEFHRDDSGWGSGFEAMGQTFHRVDPNQVPRVPEAWQKFLGTYGPEFIPLVISVRYGHLYAMTENLADYRLTPLNRMVFKMPPGMYADEELVFQTDAEGRVHSAVLAGMVLRRQ